MRTVHTVLASMVLLVVAAWASAFQATLPTQPATTPRPAARS